MEENVSLLMLTQQTTLLMETNKCRCSVAIMGRYERDEMKPSIDVVKKLAEELGTTVGYLLGEAKESLLLKDPVMLKRFQEINELEDSDKQCVYTFLDAFLAKNKLQAFLK